MRQLGYAAMSGVVGIIVTVVVAVASIGPNVATGGAVALNFPVAIFAVPAGVVIWGIMMTVLALSSRSEFAAFYVGVGAGVVVCAVLILFSHNGGSALESGGVLNTARPGIALPLYWLTADIGRRAFRKRDPGTAEET